MAVDPRGTLSDAQIDEFREAFDMFDPKGNGCVGPDEFRAMMRTLGLQLTEKEITELLEEVDEDGSGDIHFDEMLGALVKNMRDATYEEEIDAAFKSFDRDGKGVITKVELARVMQDLGEDMSVREAESILRSANHNRPKITRAEFMQMLFACDEREPG